MQARFRIDGVNIDHFRAAAETDEGPISWITSGKIDAVFDIKFPPDNDESGIDLILGEIAEAISSAAERIPGQKILTKPALSPPDDDKRDVSADTPSIIIDMDLRFRDVKAAVPLFTKDLSYVNSALIRPIVAFIKQVASHQLYFP